MSDLIVVGYDDMFKAEEVRLKLLKMQKEYLVDLEDAVVAVTNFTLAATISKMPAGTKTTATTPHARWG